MKSYVRSDIENQDTGQGGGGIRATVSNSKKSYPMSPTTDQGYRADLKPVVGVCQHGSNPKSSRMRAMFYFGHLSQLLH